MTGYIGAPLNATAKKIAITKGADRVFSLRRREPTSPNAPMDWNAEVWIDIVLDAKTTPTRVAATVAGSLATIRIESTVADQLKTNMKWRVIMSEEGDPTLETPVMVGTFERNDG